jgi:hypothetical protein
VALSCVCPPEASPASPSIAALIRAEKPLAVLQAVPAERQPYERSRAWLWRLAERELAVKRLEQEVARSLARAPLVSHSVDAPDALRTQMGALLADPRLLMSTRSPLRAALWLVLLRPTPEVLTTKSRSAHPLLAFAEALIRAALNGHRRAFDQIANRIEGRVANRLFETQPIDDGPAAAARRLMIEMVCGVQKKPRRP